MLFVLTGDIQCGKTRWLSTLVDELEAAGVRVGGMLAPGVWKPRKAGEYNKECQRNRPGDFEKWAIDNVLLPQHETIRFASRIDSMFMGEGAGPLDPNTVHLGWDIPQSALDAVNGHLDSLAERAVASGSLSSESADGAGIIILDELGRLELLKGQGLVSILKLLDVGPTNCFPNALVIVRERILPALDTHDFSLWDGYTIIRPDNDGKAAVFIACGLS